MNVFVYVNVLMFLQFRIKRDLIYLHLIFLFVFNFMFVKFPHLDLSSSSLFFFNAVFHKRILHIIAQKNQNAYICMQIYIFFLLSMDMLRYFRNYILPSKICSERYRKISMRLLVLLKKISIQWNAVTQGNLHICLYLCNYLIL